MKWNSNLKFLFVLIITSCSNDFDSFIPEPINLTGSLSKLVVHSNSEFEERYFFKYSNDGSLSSVYVETEGYPFDISVDYTYFEDSVVLGYNWIITDTSINDTATLGLGYEWHIRHQNSRITDISVHSFDFSDSTWNIESFLITYSNGRLSRLETPPRYIGGSYFSSFINDSYEYDSLNCIGFVYHIYNPFGGDNVSVELDYTTLDFNKWIPEQHMYSGDGPFGSPPFYTDDFYFLQLINLNFGFQNSQLIKRKNSRHFNYLVDEMNQVYQMSTEIDSSNLRVEYEMTYY